MCNLFCGTALVNTNAAFLQYWYYWNVFISSDQSDFGHNHNFLKHYCQILQTQLEIDKALEADPTVYEYDSIYDSMQEKKMQQVTSSKETAKTEKKVWSSLNNRSDMEKRTYLY